MATLPGMMPPAPMPAAPAAAPEALGLKVRARAGVKGALKILEISLPVLGADTEEGKSLIAAIKALGSIFQGEPKQGLVENELEALRAQASPDPAGMALTGPRPQAVAGF